jgi:integrase
VYTVTTKGEKALVGHQERWSEFCLLAGLTCARSAASTDEPRSSVPSMGGAVEQSYVRHLLPRLAAKTGIEKRVHAYGLRHAYAVDLEREGATISTIRDLLGHSCASVTDRYLRRLGAGEAVESARKREWSL